MCKMCVALFQLSSAFMLAWLAAYDAPASGNKMRKVQVVVATFWLYSENIEGCNLLLVISRELGSCIFPQVVA
jgi:hypothetical protein